MDCKVCFEKFDKQKRKPITINCGHSYCVVCLNVLIKKKNFVCPTCRSPITNEKTNYTVMEILDLNPLFDPNREIKVHINNAFKEFEDTKKAFDLKCNEKKYEIKSKIDSMKSKINERASELINRILTRQDSLNEETEKIQNSLNEKFEKFLATKHVELVKCETIETMENKELVCLKQKINEANNTLKSKQYQFDQIDSYFEFDIEVDNNHELGKIKTQASQAALVSVYNLL